MQWAVVTRAGHSTLLGDRHGPCVPVKRAASGRKMTRTCLACPGRKFRLNKPTGDTRYSLQAMLDVCPLCRRSVARQIVSKYNATGTGQLAEQPRYQG